MATTHTYQSSSLRSDGERFPIPYEIMKRLTLPEQNLLRSYIDDITAHAADDHTPSPQPHEEQFDIIRLSFYVIITVASILAVLCVYNSCR